MNRAMPPVWVHEVGEEPPAPAWGPPAGARGAGEIKARPTRARERRALPSGGGTRRKMMSLATAISCVGQPSGLWGTGDLTGGAMEAGRGATCFDLVFERS